jgi:hypothetical protein
MGGAPNGRVEYVTRYFAIGWAANDDALNHHVVASLEDTVLGTAIADIPRSDLPLEPKICRAFLIAFVTPIDPDQVSNVKVRSWNGSAAFQNTNNCRLDGRTARQLFIVGSPRSASSELAATLSKQLDLAWSGEELHAAPVFGAMESALVTGLAPKHVITAPFSKTYFVEATHELTRRYYHLLHLSAAFLDKTPGTEMILALPFLQRCFPGAKFICVQRNGVSNVLSRMAKFGGCFTEHCEDWNAAITAWDRVRLELKHTLLVKQEDMMADPDAVSITIARFLGEDAAAAGISRSLRLGTRERTGAGLGRSRLSETDWSAEQIETFKQVCGMSMDRLGYDYM